MTQEFMENEILFVTKSIMDKSLEQKNPSDIISLYMFYYYTAKWQKTNRPKCTTGYAAKGLKISEERIRAAKKVLIELGFISDHQDKDDGGHIKGWYIQINYIFSKAAINTIHTVERPQGGEIHRVEKEETNTLSTSIINPLSTSIINTMSAKADFKSMSKKQKSGQEEKDLALYKEIEAAFREKTSWTRFKVEGKAIKEIIKKCRFFSEDDPGGFAAKMMHVYYEMTETEKFYKSLGFFPSGLNYAFDKILLKAKDIITKQKENEEALRIHREACNER